MIVVHRRTAILHSLRAVIAPLAVAGLGLALAGLSLALAPRASASRAAAPVAQDGVSPCVATGDLVADPSVILGGESARVTATFRAVCASEPISLHLVLVLDGSAAMEGEPEREQKKHARMIVQRLNLKDEPGIRVAVVTHGDGRAQQLCALSNASGEVNGCIGRVGNAGDANLDGALDRAQRALLDGRADVGEPDALREAVLVMHGGPLEGGACSDALGAAQRLKGQGVLVMTHCVMRGCSNQCLREMATSPRYALSDADGAALWTVFQQIVDRGGLRLLRELVVRARLGENAPLVPGSAEPAPNASDERELEWRTAFVPSEGVTFAWSASPFARGRLRLTEGVTAVFTDNQGLTGTLAYTDVAVTVLQPAPRPTEPGGPTATATMAPATTTATATATEVAATATPAPVDGNVYLPALVRNVGMRDTP